MNRFEKYIQRQEEKIRKAKRNIELAERLYENGYRMGFGEEDPDLPFPKLGFGDSYDVILRIESSNERTKVTDFIGKAESPDPVFRKLSETTKIAYGYVSSFLVHLMTMLAMRQGMSELEYDYVNSVSPRKLVNQLRKIEQEFGTSKADMKKGFSMLVESHYQAIQEKKLQE